MKPSFWFGIAAAAFGVGIACIEIGVKQYVNDDHWDKALAVETRATDGISGDKR